MASPLTRRTVLGSALALAGASALGCAGRGQRPGAGQRYDVLVQGGTVYDGTGAPGVAADVGIVGGRIVAIGALAGAGARTRLDARGLAVAPGFSSSMGRSRCVMASGGRTGRDVPCGSPRSDEE